MGEAKRQKKAGPMPAPRNFLWHTTRHENVEPILCEGFKDHAFVRKHIPGFGIPDDHFPPGVWVGDTPAIDDELFDGICLFGFKAEQQAFIRIEVEDGALRGEEWHMGTTWPGRQWLVSAVDLSVYPRVEVSLDDAIRFRFEHPVKGIANRSDVAKFVKESGRDYDLDFLDRVRRLLEEG